MIALNNGDSIRGSASAASAIDYTIHGVVGNTVTLIADGQLPSTEDALYTAADNVVIADIILVNTSASEVTIDLFIQQSGGTSRRVIPKTMALTSGYSAHVTGDGVVVVTSDGGILTQISEHAATHQNGGDDEINVAGLSGELADPQPPKTHASSHQNGGSDEINVAGLSGELADPQTPKTHADSHEYGGADVVNNVAARVYRSTTQSIPDNTETKLQFDSKTYDLSNNYDNTTNYRFTCPGPGIYAAASFVFLTSGNWDTDEAIEFMVFKNGTRISNLAHKRVDATSGGWRGIWGYAEVYCDTNDYLEIYIKQNSGVAQDTYNTSPSVWATFRKVL